MDESHNVQPQEQFAVQVLLRAQTMYKFKTVLKVFAFATRQEKEIKDIQIEKEEMKLYLQMT